MKKIELGGNTFECDIDPIQIPMVERMIKGSTDSDDAIRAMGIPESPLWLHFVVKALYWYRRSISPKLGNRCVFEPSCSHYAELALRNKGFIQGITLTIKRLYRCRPGNGGIDLP